MAGFSCLRVVNSVLQAIAHAAHGDDLYAGVGQLLAQPMDQDLDGLQVDIAVAGLDAIEDLLLVQRFAAALDQARSTACSGAKAPAAAL